MSLCELIRSDLRAAQKDATAEGKRRLQVLRMAAAALQNEEIAKRVKDKGLTDEEAQAVIKREVKRRKEAAQMYRTHGEDVRAQEEEAELTILAHYLPAALKAEDIQKGVEEILSRLSEEERTMGRVMKEAMAHFKGAADGAQVKEAVVQTLKGG